MALGEVRTSACPPAGHSAEKVAEAVAAAALSGAVPDVDSSIMISLPLGSQRIHKVSQNIKMVGLRTRWSMWPLTRFC